MASTEIKPLSKRYETAASGLKVSILEFLEEKMKNGTEKEKMEISLTAIKSKLFDDSTTIKGDNNTIIFREYDNDLRTNKLAETSITKSVKD
ncbi:MAG: hypothetical protein WD512_01510 [Candidatus Paceibacterota bacterium]